MSTEHQQYSLENQAAAIARYACEHGFVVTQTYTDAGKSGVVLNRRHGLRQLLHDVISEAATHKVVLVYDVSRWGRFQDVDEAAHHAPTFTDRTERDECGNRPILTGPAQLLNWSNPAATRVPQVLVKIEVG